MSSWLNPYGPDEECRGKNCNRIITHQQKMMDVKDLPLAERWAFCTSCLFYYCPKCKNNYGVDRMEGKYYSRYDHITNCPGPEDSY